MPPGPLERGHGARTLVDQSSCGQTASNPSVFRLAAARSFGTLRPRLKSTSSACARYNSNRKFISLTWWTSQSKFVTLTYIDFFFLFQFTTHFRLTNMEMGPLARLVSSMNGEFSWIFHFHFSRLKRTASWRSWLGRIGRKERYPVRGGFVTACGCGSRGVGFFYLLRQALPLRLLWYGFGILGACFDPTARLRSPGAEETPFAFSTPCA